MKQYKPASHFFLPALLGVWALGFSTSTVYAVTITTPSATAGGLIEAADWNRVRTDLQNLATEVNNISGGTSVWSTSSGDVYVSTGSVGIGTTTPSSDLNVVSSNSPVVRVTGGNNLDASLQLLELNNTPDYGAEFHYDGNQNKLHIGMFDNSANRDDAIVIRRDNAYVGIGGEISPDYPLHVQGQTRFDGSVGINKAPDGSYGLDVSGGARKTAGGKNWTTSSDRRLKNIIGSYDLGLEQVLELNPTIFEYKAENPRGLPSGVRQYGFIAQEVADILPEAVEEDPVDGYLNLNTSSLELALVNAVKALHAQNQALKSEIEALKVRLP